MAEPHTQAFMGRNQLVSRLVAQVGSDKAGSILEKNGHAVNGKLTPKGEARNQMTAEERAIDRSGNPSAVYDPATNSTSVT